MLFRKFSQGLIVTICLFGVGGVSHSEYTPTGFDTARFSKITPWTQTRWATQLIFAPRTLDEIVPVYVSKLSKINNNEELNALLERPISHIGLLPPRLDDKGDPTNCGILVNLSSDGYRKSRDKLTWIKKTVENPEVTEFAKNCTGNPKETLTPDWFLAIPSILPINDTNDVLLMWTTTRDWKNTKD